MSAVGAIGPTRARSAARRFDAAFGPAFAALVGATAVGFAHAYAGLAPLLGSESPESLLLLVPFTAGYILWRSLADAGRDGNELTVNLFLSIPLLIVLTTLLLWLPSRLSYFYWVYRLDLLGVPCFVALAVLLLFGATALWRSRWAIGVLVLGWPPILDSALGLVTDRASTAQASLLGLIPLGATHVGNSFLVRGGGAITVAAPCSGLLAVVSMLLVGGVTVAFRAGAARRKLAWLATAVALAFAANVVRLALVVAVAAHTGVDTGFTVFHALAGPLLFALTLLAALPLLHSFGLERRAAPHREQRPPVVLPVPVAAALAATLAAFTGVAWWSTSAVRTPGLFHGVIALDSTRLLPLPSGYQRSGIVELASLGALFGAGSEAELTHIDRIDGDAVAAQVVLTSSYRRAQRYNVLDCFVFHHARVYSTHVEPMVAGGSGVLTAVQFDHRDVATLTWIQPALVDGRRAWRRVLLFAYLDGAHARSPIPHVPSSQHFGAWLLDRFGPYGATAPPARFTSVERGLVALADQLALPNGNVAL